MSKCRRRWLLDEAGERTLKMAVRQVGPFCARTLADMGGSAGAQAKHVAEGVQYGSMDRSYWN
jgi:predicted ATPase with chaperone activity